MGRNQIEIIALVKKFVYKMKNLNLDKVILFGSYARNKQRKNSDVDLLIISNNFKNIKSFKRAKELYLNWDIDMGVDFICLTNEELEKKKKEIGIVSEALREGVVIK